MSLFYTSEGPGNWQNFVKRSDIKNLPVLEQKRKYLTEQLQFEDFISQQLHLLQVARFQQTQAQGGSVDSEPGGYVFADKSALSTAVGEWNNDEAAATLTYGDINTWDVSAVTDMSQMFQFSGFNSDISNWDVSNVTNMSQMFYFDPAFNQDISSWNVSNVTNMSNMFNNVADFNQDLSSWDVSSVTNMSNMFTEVMFFNQDLSSWDVSSVTNMSAMFKLTGLPGDISNWDVSNVTDMSFMFEGNSSMNSYTSNLGNWDVSSVTTMYNMFAGVELLTTTYDAILIGWAAQTLQSSVPFYGGSSLYSAGAAATARGVLTGAPNSWTITDGGQV